MVVKDPNGGYFENGKWYPCEVENVVDKCKCANSYKTCDRVDDDSCCDEYLNKPIDNSLLHLVNIGNNDTSHNAYEDEIRKKLGYKPLKCVDSTSTGDDLMKKIETIYCDELPDSIVTREDESITEGELVAWDGNIAIVKHPSASCNNDHICNCKRYEPTINWKFIIVILLLVMGVIIFKFSFSYFFR